MSKKNLDDTQNLKPEPIPDGTKPVRTGRKIFKDQPISESVKNDESALIDQAETMPIKPSTKKESPVDQLRQDLELEAVKEEKPAKKRRGKWVWLGILIMLVITAMGTGYGYWSAMQSRKAHETNQRLELATTQFVKADQDFTNGNFEMASTRLQYILTIYPDYPGLDEKLKEVLTAISISQPNAPVSENTAEPAFTPVATKDTSVVSVLFPQAQAQLNASDWQGLYDTVTKMRDIDPSYQAIKVDGFYYYALRYTGITKIQNGQLEVGLYYLSMAEKIAPLDADVESWRNWAGMYQIAGSWFGVNYQKATEEFQKVARDVPNLMDASKITAKQRYIKSLEGWGDTLMKMGDYCNAVIQYQNSKDLFANDAILAKWTQAQEYCANPPATPTPTVDPNAPEPTPTKDSYDTSQ